MTRDNRSDRPIPKEIVGCNWKSLAFAWMNLKEKAEDMEAALIEIRDADRTLSDARQIAALTLDLSGLDDVP
ncbi:MAG TPA: hypothetical protein DG761_04835 [Gammaproteobacteria bacterium]|nr:hypothetical protein [Gammaproteobacteria bacterium]|tara:strand:+ start:323 stop:538 length:216 start_codon:yes stop_codon:yes gene_type:complete